MIATATCASSYAITQAQMQHLKAWSAQLSRGRMHKCSPREGGEHLRSTTRSAAEQTTSRTTRRTVREAARLEGLRRNRALFFTDVSGQWTNQRIVFILFHNVRSPAGNAGHDEDRGEELNIETKDVGIAPGNAVHRQYGDKDASGNQGCTRTLLY